MKLKLVNIQSHSEIDLDMGSSVVLGRGTLLGCNVKNISRNHGLIQLTPDGSVHLTALHTNPCFFMKNGVPPILALKKTEKKVLSDGDYIGFLPDSFWYKLVVIRDGNNDSSLLGVYGLKSEEEFGTYAASNKFISQSNIINSTKSMESSSPIKSECDKTKVTMPDPDEKQQNESSVSQMSSNILGVTNVTDTSEPFNDKIKKLENTKKLPLWMYEIDDFPVDNDKSDHNIPILVDSLGTREEKTDQGKIDCSEMNDLHSDTLDEARPTREKMCVNERSSENLEIVKENVIKEPMTESTTKVFNTKQIQNNNSTELASGSSSGNQKRPICQYEQNCYRKNEDHRKEFSHPGDVDYLPYENRPVCPYGLSCYRKNKAHHIEYQHPKKKSENAARNNLRGPPKAKKPKKQLTYCSTSEEDDYDLEDPFIYDGSSDDFVPSESELDDEEEDEPD